MADFKARDYILKGKQIIEQKPDFSTVETAVSKGKLYKDVDNDGDTYYYRGAVEDNYFKFGDKFYRIIRINGNGSIRLIYDGSKAYANDDTSSANDRAIGANAYNSQTNDNKYVGFRYEQDVVHGYAEPSTILGADENPTENTLNKWYEDNILNTDLEKYIDKNAGFICDRTNSTSSSTLYENMNDNGGIRTKETYYGAYARLVKAKLPIFTFKNNDDYFTTKNTEKGNKSLIYPVGLITADEVAYAGGACIKDNSNYYLYTGIAFWTMSPSYFLGGVAFVFRVGSGGGLNDVRVYYSTYGLRPVINILGSVNLIGDGTMDSPYEIAAEPVIHHKLAKNGEIIQSIYKNGKKLLGIAHAGELIWKYEEPKPKYRIMTIKIDQNNSDPEACCTYADDAVDMTPGSSDWDDFFGHYPVMLLNGVEGKKLNRNDFTKHEDGSSADITTGAEGDVMIAFPRRGVKISTSGNIITVSMTDDPNKDGFEYNAHRRNDTQKDVFYLGAYKGYEMSSKLRSLSGKKPTVSKTIGAFRTSAQANGKSNGTSSGYEQSGWFQLIFRQVMYLLKFKNLNSQSAVGNGYTNSSNSASVNTGGTDTYGMDSELIKASNPSYMTDGKHQVKCLGLEDFWGNIYEWIDGMGTDGSGNIMTATTNFNDSRSNYKNSGQGGNSLSGYIKTVQGSTEAGFAIKTSGGSETTCFSDYGSLYSSSFPVYGGGWDNGGYAGAFCLDVRYSASYSSSGLGARLMYL